MIDDRNSSGNCKFRPEGRIKAVKLVREGTEEFRRGQVLRALDAGPSSALKGRGATRRLCRAR